MIIVIVSLQLQLTGCVVCAHHPAVPKLLKKKKKKRNHRTIKSPCWAAALELGVQLWKEDMPSEHVAFLEF